MIEEDETKEKENFSSGDNEVVGVKVNRAKNPIQKDKGKNVISEAVKTENDASAKKKKRQNRNSKVGINKSNNYAYIPNAPREVCQKCASTSH